MATVCPIQHFVNDIGKSIEFLVKNCDVTVEPSVSTLVDISSATEQDITFIKPDGTNLDVTGSFLTDGTDSISRYVTIDGDLDLAGDWEGQLRIKLSDGQFYSSIIEFEVEEHL